MYVKGLVVGVDRRAYTRADKTEVVGADVIVADDTLRETVHIEYSNIADVPAEYVQGAQIEVAISRHGYLAAIRRCKFTPVVNGSRRTS
jgi:hypothetical protein